MIKFYANAADAKENGGTPCHEPFPSPRDIDTGVSRPQELSCLSTSSLSGTVGLDAPSDLPQLVQWSEALQHPLCNSSLPRAHAKASSVKTSPVLLLLVAFLPVQPVRVRTCIVYSRFPLRASRCCPAKSSSPQSDAQGKVNIWRQPSLKWQTSPGQRRSSLRSWQKLPLPGPAVRQVSQNILQHLQSPGLHVCRLLPPRVIGHQSAHACNSHQHDNDNRKHNNNEIAMKRTMTTSVSTTMTATTVATAAIIWCAKRPRRARDSHEERSWHVKRDHRRVRCA